MSRDSAAAIKATETGLLHEKPRGNITKNSSYKYPVRVVIQNANILIAEISEQ